MLELIWNKISCAAQNSCLTNGASQHKSRSVGSGTARAGILMESTMNTFEDIQKIGKENLDNAVKAFEVQQKGVQAIATEVADYSKKAVEATTAQFEKLVGVKTLDKAIELQTDFAKTAYEGYVAHATKVGELFTNLAKEAAKPFEAAIAKVQAK
jgi:phasin family protein